MKTELTAAFSAVHGLAEQNRALPGEPLRVGQWQAQTVRFGILRTILFSFISGDWNRLHYCLPGASRRSPLRGYAVPGILVASRISGMLAMTLPGKGTIYRLQNISFHRPIRLYKTYMAFVQVSSVTPGKHGLEVELSTVVDELEPKMPLPPRTRNDYEPNCKGNAAVLVCSK